MNAIVWILFFSLHGLAESFTILYSGTFDPFHKVHLQEVLGAMRAFPDSTAFIMPIQRAPHTPRISATGRFQPTFLEFPEILDVITASLESPEIEPELRKAISLNLAFQTLEGENSGIAQADTTERIAMPKKAHLIGTDILKVWEKKGFLERMLKTGYIIVSKDPDDPETYNQQKRKYENHPKMRFIDVVKDSVRSTDLRLRSLSDEPQKWIEFLAKGAQIKLTLNASDHTGLVLDRAKGNTYLQKMKLFGTEFFTYEILPRLNQIIDGFEQKYLQEKPDREFRQIKLMSFLHSRIVEKKTDDNFFEPAYMSEVKDQIETLANPQILGNLLIDGARTVKTLRVMVNASPSSQRPSNLNCNEKIKRNMTPASVNSGNL